MISAVKTVEDSLTVYESAVSLEGLLLSIKEKEAKASKQTVETSSVAF